MSIETATATVRSLTQHALKLERVLDAHASTTIADILRAASARLEGKLSGDLPLVRDQVAKGLRFAAATAAPSPVALDDRAARLLDQIAYLQAQVADGERAGVALSTLDDEDMLASFVAPSEATPGRSPVEVLTNLQRTFDEHLATARYGAGDPAPVVGIDALQSLLGPRTVLISIYLAAHGDGRLAAQTQAFTADSHAATLIPLGIPADPFVLECDGVRLTQSPVGQGVSELRRRVVEEPMFGDVDDDASAILGAELPRWFGRFAGRLSDWQAAGFDHLVVWPHGPLHYLPWQLYGSGGPIADHWTVTVLPTLAPLLRPRAPGGDGLVAVGCAEGGRAFGLRSAPTMPAQAQAVAAAFGVEAVADATPQRVLDAMPGVRFVHLAAHGSHLEEAPAFQCLYLNPGEDGEGRIFAHQVARLDLRGVELVTLSTCESALGRFDVSDNLRGLPAALLAAGAAAVVGATWPVAPDAATTFFTTLYARLGAGSGRLRAFRDAQIATRQRHPEYRDWGAMSYLGDWR